MKAFRLGASRTPADSARFNAFKSLLLSGFLITGLTPQLSQAATDSAGFTPGELSVSPTGAALYQVPIAVPPGVAGMQPELSITYNSQGGDGLLGLGFGLSGLSTIHRCGATYEQDGFKGGVYYDARDRFCLDGQRLIAVVGTDGGSGTEYRTEIDGISRIISHGQQGSGPSYWQVQTKSGQTLEFGNTADSKIDTRDGVNVRAWALNTMLDAVSNAITISYYEDTASGEHLPIRIDYGQNSVRFDYEDRPVIKRQFQAGSQITLSKRMSAISTYASEILVRKYRLRYAVDSYRNRLEGITEQSGAGETHPEIVFSWAAESAERFENGSEWVDGNTLDKGDKSFIVEYDTSDNIETMLLDINGDGIVDRLVRDVFGGDWNPKDKLWVLEGTGAPYTTEVQWGEDASDPDGEYIKMTDTSTGDVIWDLLDITGDGKPDRVFHKNPHNGSKGFYVMENTGNGFTHGSRWQDHLSNNLNKIENFDSNGEKWVGLLDMNGDGLADRVFSVHHQTSAAGLFVSLNSGSDFGPVTQWGTDIFGDDYLRETNSGGDVLADLVDMNGDGLPDRVLDRDPVSGVQGFYVMLNDGVSSFDQGAQWLPDLGDDWKNRIEEYSSEDKRSGLIDLNGDGLPDRVFDSNPYTNVEGIHVMLNNGVGFEPVEEWIPDTGSTKDNRVDDYDGGDLQNSFIDMNSDGLPDRVYWRKPGTNTLGLYVKINTGNGFDNGGFWLDGFDNYYDNDDWSFEASHREWNNVIREKTPSGNVLSDIMDMNGDGLPDRVFYTSPYDRRGGMYVMLNQTTIPRVVNITSVMENSTLTYTPMTDKSIYEQGASGSYPTIDIAMPMAVVTQVATENGIGGQNSTSYRYGEGRLNLKGRGFLGFNWMEATDQQTGIVTKTTYRQDFPYTGQVERTEQRLSDNTLIGETDVTFAEITSFDGKAHFPYALSSVDKSYELDGSHITTTTTDNEYDAYGNALRITVTTTDGVNSVVKDTLNDYINNTDDWHLGRLTRATVTHTNAQGNVTRTSAFEYNTDGLLNKEIIEPDNAALRLETGYTYDSYGNKLTATTSGQGISSRTTTTAYSTDGRFPVSVTNALGHTETRTYDPVHGVMLSLTGPNGLTTSWSYDSFGRKIREDRADGTWTTITRGLCDGSGGCPANAQVGTVLYTVTETTGGAPATQYADKLGRVIRKESTGFDGTAVFSDTEYNSLGQIARLSKPYYPGDTTYWTRYEYDEMGRVVFEFSPTESDPGALTTDNRVQRIYAGLAVTEINALGYETTRIKNLQDKLAQVIDQEASMASYVYDAVGNLLRSNDGYRVLSEMTYDDRGRKTAMVDEDMGSWSYSYNVLGELISQTDAKAQTVTMTHDALGRKVSRVESEGTTTWIYDTAANGIGKLAQVNGPNGFVKSHAYDQYGRATTTTTTVNGESFTQSVSYDSYSRVSSRTSPTGFVVVNNYNAYGHLASISNSGGTTTYWQANAVDAQGRALLSTLGNGLETVRQYDLAQGYLKGILTGNNGSVQFLTYGFDNLGNLTSRADANQSLSETFLYDGLNRLTDATVAASGALPAINKTYTYDSVGNITHKSDVGDYTYGTGIANGAGVHAVTQAGSNSYTYDANGNMSGGAGRVMVWSSFNKPLSIVRGDASVNFEYDADHNRIRSIRSKLVDGSPETTTTVYLGKSYERVTLHQGIIEHKHYIQVAGATVLYTERSNNVNDTRYLHKDHQGSTDVITDETAQVVERMSFDAFGARRQTNWQDPLTQLFSQFSRGYTGHEHFDGVGLIHMNGRVYDPELGRFLSADPHVQSFANAQSLNRYTYVNNNPLSYTDPSGYFFKKIFRGIAVLMKNPVVAAAVSFAFIQIVGPMIKTAMMKSWFASAAVITPSTVGSAYATASFVSSSLAGFGAGMLASGGDLKAALYGALSAGMAYQIGHGIGANWGPYTKAVAHGATQGVLTAARGGKFKEGFFGAVAGHAVGGKLMNLLPNNPAGRTIAAATIGGISASLGGGKFANGAVSAAFTHLFNTEFDGGSDAGKKTKQDLLQGAQDGHLTLGEANAWYRNGNGQPLTVDASRLTVKIFRNIGSGRYSGKVVGEDFLVHGSVTLKLGNRGGFEIMEGMYDFEWHDPFKYNNPMEGFKRNILTIGGNIVSGPGDPYMIKYSGYPKLLP